MNKLVEQIVNELKLQLFSEEDVNNTRIVAVYPGRFQPMALHHKAAYDWLVKQFGEENVFVTTSNKVDPQRSPLNFEEKKRIMEKHGIKNIVQLTNPYGLREFMEKMNLDPQTTTLIYMTGEKDIDRIKKFKRNTRFNRTTSVPVKDFENPFVYYVIAPHVAYQIPSFGEMSGTTVRQALGDRNAKLSELKSRFKSIMGWFDSGIFNTVIKKFNINRGDLKDGLREDLNEWFRVLLNMTEVQGEMFFSILKKEYGDTKDLLPLIQKFIKTKSLTGQEKEIFQKQMKDIFKLMGLGAIAAIPIPGTMLLIPVIVQAAKKFNINLLPESAKPERLSIVRREFWNEVFQEVLRDEKSVLMEGGAAGRMQHPFDDMGLTFGDLKEMFRLGLSGELSINNSPTEKVDGMNLVATFKDGKLRVARKASDIKTGGIDYTTLQQRYEGYDEVKRAFSLAFEDLEAAFKKLPSSQTQAIFNGGNTWLNLEILYPENDRILNYDGAYLVLHGTNTYDDKGKVISSDGSAGTTLSNMIQAVNANTQKTFSITKPKELVIGKSKDFDAKLQEFTTQLTTLQNQMGCSDSDTISVWHQHWWEKYITSEVKKLGGNITDEQLLGLTKRWAFGDKSYSLTKKNITDESVLGWAKELDKTKYAAQMKKNMYPFEILILRFGAEVLKNVKTFVSANPDKTVQNIKTKLTTAIEQLSKSTDIKTLSLFKRELDRIEKIGGIQAIAPSEGIVFVFKGKTYKLTGAFAPINQIMNLLGV